MAEMGILIGIVLIATGVVGYGFSETNSMTAWIPAIFGIIIGLCGLVALKKKRWHKRAMQVGALVALMGAIGAATRLPKTYYALQGPDGGSLLAFACQLDMFVFCAAFFLLALMSLVRSRWFERG